MYDTYRSVKSFICDGSHPQNIFYESSLVRADKGLFIPSHAAGPVSRRAHHFGLLTSYFWPAFGICKQAGLQTQPSTPWLVVNIPTWPVAHQPATVCVWNLSLRGFWFTFTRSERWGGYVKPRYWKAFLGWVELPCLKEILGQKGKKKVVLNPKC